MRVKKFPTIKRGLLNFEYLLRHADDVDYREALTAYPRYNEMMRRVADHYCLPLDRVTAAFVALSPNNDYVGNLRSLITLIESRAAGVPLDDIVCATYRHCLVRANHYLDGGEFETETRGPKILNFYRNILDPSDPYSVTIDGHMVAAYYGDSNMNMKEAIVTESQYRTIATATYEMARRHGLLANQIQAMIWFTRKRVFGIKYNPRVDMFRPNNDKWQILVPLKELKPYEQKTKQPTSTRRRKATSTNPTTQAPLFH